MHECSCHYPCLLFTPRCLYTYLHTCTDRTVWLISMFPRWRCLPPFPNAIKNIFSGIFFAKGGELPYSRNVKLGLAVAYLQILRPLWTPIAFDALSFWNGAKYRWSKTPPERPYESSSFWITHLVHSSLIFT